MLQAFGMVNRAGLGVDRIYEELLAMGKYLTRYDADESHVRLTGAYQHACRLRPLQP